MKGYHLPGEMVRECIDEVPSIMTGVMVLSTYQSCKDNQTQDNHSHHTTKQILTTR